MIKNGLFQTKVVLISKKKTVVPLKRTIRKPVEAGEIF
jgi:hypothetical protein